MNDLIPVEQKPHEIEIDDELLRMEGMGAEDVKAKDTTVPRLVITQGLSPQLNPKKVEYIKGASLGDFCNVGNGDVYTGSITVIPVYFITNFLQWKKDRAGLVNNFGDDASIIQKTTRNEKGEFILPNGDSIQETAQWYCLLNVGGNWERIFFPLKATMLKHSRKWMTLCRAETVKTRDKTGKEILWRPPLFWRSWELTSIEESNTKGSWFVFKADRMETTLELDPSRVLLNACKDFYSDLKGGKVKVDIEATRDDVHGDGNGNGHSNGKAMDDKDIPF